MMTSTNKAKPQDHPNFSVVLKLAIETYAELRKESFETVAQRMLDGDQVTTRHIFLLMESVA